MALRLGQSFIICLHKGKRDALGKDNYCGLNVTKQVMKVLERIETALSDRWCILAIPSLALSQVEAQQMQSLSSGSSKKII